jgi:ribonuclease E
VTAAQDVRAADTTAAVDATPEAQAPAAVAPVDPVAAEAEAVAMEAVVEAVAPAPVAAPFVLPLAALQDIAQAAGLEWVNSDADKIRVAQEAIANEPRPVHVPRERKPAVVIDEGPLILVETRKDLSQVSLPFEQNA